MVGTVVEARKLNLSLSSSHSKVISSLLYEPNSLSLALFHSDSSISLFSKFTPFFSVSSLVPQTLISPPNSSACFVGIENNDFKECPDGKDVVFVTCRPHDGGGKVLLRFYVLGRDGKFVSGAHVGCSQNGVCFDRKYGGVVVDMKHGVKVMMCGSVNYFAMYSVSDAKVWVFGLKLSEDRPLRLVKCAVIECRLPVVSICVSFGFLVLGELNGVRVFPLRALVKGKVGSRKKSRGAKGKGDNSNGGQQGEVSVKLEKRKLKRPNGVTRPFGESCVVDRNMASLFSSNLLANGHGYSVLDRGQPHSNADGNHDAVKPRSLKVLQDSGEWGMQFVSFDDSIYEGVKAGKPRCKTAKAISIQALSQQKFLILDSNGELHVVHVSKSGSTQMRHLPCAIQVQQMAAFPDMSANLLIVWTSDGLYSVHIMMMPVTDSTEIENSGSSGEGKISQYSVTQAIFASEKIQDMIAVAGNAVLILGQDGLFAYAIS